MFGTLIGSVTVGAGGAASIDFTSIPGTYTDLLLVVSARSAVAGNLDGVVIKFNSSSTGYSGKSLLGSGTAASSASTNDAGLTPAAGSTASVFSNSMTYIPNYAGSTNKVYSTETVTENNAAGAYQSLQAGLWSNTAAITSISLVSENASTWTQYSTAYLYGITKGTGGATAA